MLASGAFVLSCRRAETAYTRLVIYFSIPVIMSMFIQDQSLAMDTSSILVSNSCGDGTFYDADAGACCRTCPQGHGVALPCTGVGIGNDTVCSPCVDGAAYSSSISHEESCQPCSHCPPNAHAVHRCNVTHNTKCECVDGYWYSPDRKTCVKCFPCQPGFEATRSCGPYQNTHCVPCAKGYYSDSYGYSTKCRLCSLCKPGQLVQTACSAGRDTECVDAKALLNGIGTTNAPPVSGVNLFPVYCAIPAVILVALIFFVVFKRWKYFTCNRSAPCKSATTFNNPQGPIPYSTASSIVKGQQKCANSKHGTNADGTASSTCQKELKPMLLTGDSPVHCLPKDLLEQLEMNLGGSNDEDRSGWLALAKHLGYGDARIKAFIKDACVSRVPPAKKFLHDWSYSSHATVRLLIDALDSIERSDLATLLRRDIDLSTTLMNNNNQAIIGGPVHFV